MPAPTTSVLPLGGDSHLGLAFAHRARRHRYRVIDPDEAGGVAIEALHRDNAQETGLFIQHGERSPRRADDIAHRADDGARRVFETKRLTQDLVEGVKEVDLLVAGGQLFGEVGGLPVGPQEKREEGEHRIPFPSARGFQPERRSGSERPDAAPLG